jgi:hypothetical protein
MIQDTDLAIKTTCLAIVASVSAVSGFNLAQWDLVLGMLFKALGCISTVVIIIINWKTLVERIKESSIFGKKK